ncbi:hypothetical protein EJV47_02770 [Hymenobacter gummosus]|uniref:DUF3575 domain-containing protein n=1 Tax=Hymenobacter gummosus TaxID=1776032 RepID=A0A3S0HAK6_9BACT|nr:hypothetical protein [Hymenobacter gummosus]RTQ53677.1 hypothetical protein EJV47_02770 [Hymenobacter gummosus]
MQLSVLALALPLAALTTSTALAQQADTPPPTPAPAAAPAPLVAPALTAPPATLFKLGLDAPRLWLGYWGVGVPLYAGVERQLGRHFSLTGDVNVGVGFGGGRRGPELQRFGGALGTRYYYGQARRLRKGKSVAALSGTYLQLQVASEFEGRLLYDYPYNQRLYRHTPSLELLWGYQRRLGRYGFMDVGAGLKLWRTDSYLYNGGTIEATRPLKLEPTLRARIGLAF